MESEEEDGAGVRSWWQAVVDARAGVDAVVISVGARVLRLATCRDIRLCAVWPAICYWHDRRAVLPASKYTIIISEWTTIRGGELTYTIM